MKRKEHREAKMSKRKYNRRSYRYWYFFPSFSNYEGKFHSVTIMIFLRVTRFIRVNFNVKKKGYYFPSFPNKHNTFTEKRAVLSD